MIRVFRHYIPASLLVLGVVEALAFFAAMYGGIALRFGLAGQDLYAIAAKPNLIFPIYPKAIIYAVIMMGVMTALGLYQREFRSRDEHWIRIIAVFGLGLIAMIAVFYILPKTFL